MNSYPRLFTCIVSEIAASVCCSTAHAEDIPAAAFYSPSHIRDHAYAAAHYQAMPVNLWDSGYVEREYFMQGGTHVYQYVSEQTSDQIEPATNAREFVNRILVREPAAPSRFSGNVIIEIINDQLNGDVPAVWPMAMRQFMRNGDIWIGLTSMPVGLDNLKRYSPDRYSDLIGPGLPGRTPAIPPPGKKMAHFMT